MDIGVGVNPEFLTEGQAVDDFLRPDRIVIGGDAGTVEVLRRLYAPFSGVPVIATSTRNAEMIKYASNALLATAISFANEIADLGSAIGDVDVAEVMAGVHASRYLTTSLPNGERVRAGLAPYLEAGCGYGGSCLPKDVAALTSRGRSAGLRRAAVDRGRRGQPAASRPVGRHGVRRARWAGGAEGHRARPRLQTRHRRHQGVAGVPRPALAARSRGRGHRPRPGGRSGGDRRLSRRGAHARPGDGGQGGRCRRDRDPVERLPRPPRPGGRACRRWWSTGDGCWTADSVARYRGIGR